MAGHGVQIGRAAPGVDREIRVQPPGGLLARAPDAVADQPGGRQRDQGASEPGLAADCLAQRPGGPPGRALAERREQPQPITQLVVIAYETGVAAPRRLT